MRKPSVITPQALRTAMCAVLSKRDMQRRLEAQWNDKFGNYDEAWEGQTDGCGFYNRLGRLIAHKCQHQYAGVGAAYYKKRSPHVGGGCIAEFISLAFEHESDPGRSSGAMNRLLTITAPLKALATYVAAGEEDDYLENYATQIRAVERAMPGFSAQQRNVVIFCIDNKREWLWKYYLFNEGRFAEMR